MKIEVGKYYRTRDGRKVGPIIANWADDECWPFKFQHYYYKFDGFSCPGAAKDHNDVDDLVSEWRDEPASPIRTQREIVPGRYGVVRVDIGHDGRILIDLWKANPDAEELREAAHILNQIAEVLENE